MISIGGRFRGPELKGSPFEQALTATVRALEEFRGPLVLGNVPLVNALFVVPGSLGDPDFDGLEYGNYVRKDKAIVVQIAVPRNVVSGSNPAEFIVLSLRGANAMAFEFFRQKGEEFPLQQAEDLVTAVAERFGVRE